MPKGLWYFWQMRQQWGSVLQHGILVVSSVSSFSLQFLQSLTYRKGELLPR